mmetsp:Transcript_8440/g.18243  ORF Transcript_8440/g.18243 Transcript_8440/m.18243 type:complete len:657 (-) Transcript_8440:26-1996(-)
MTHSLFRLAILVTGICCASAFHVHLPSLHPPALHSTNNGISSISSTRQPLRQTRVLMTMSSNNDNMPSQEEIIQQKREAYNALSAFHETSSSFTTSSSQIQSLLADLDSVGNQFDNLNNEQGGTDRGGGEVKEGGKAQYWSCEKGAIAYSVPMDPAAGLKRGIISKPYDCSVRVEMNLGDPSGEGIRRKGGSSGSGSRGLRLVESMVQRQTTGKTESEGAPLSSVPFVRSISLGANVDVDAVDGSYSLDDSITATSDSSTPLLPPWLLAGNPMAARFVVEHTLAVSETERCRCFLLYGDADGDESGDDDDDARGDEIDKSYRLLSVVLAEEKKVLPEEESTRTIEGNGVEEDDSEDCAADFISQMIETSSPSKESSSPLDLLEIDQPTEPSEEDKMARLMQSLDKHNQRVVDGMGGGSDPGNDATSTMERHSLGMFGLTSGVWLGDTFVRESLPSNSMAPSTKGFGRKQQTPTKGGTSSSAEGENGDRFATWTVGVQKVALAFEWDYSQTVSQSYTYGKCMGTATSLSSMANLKSDGVVVVNKARPTTRREERRVVWDMDNGSYVAGLMGDSYFRAPRYMNVSRGRRSYSADAYLTEFMVFYRPGKEEKDGVESAADNLGGTEYYCSRMARLYNANDGSLMQGSTAFFSMKQPLME